MLPEKRAQNINLGLLLKDGIDEVDAGFDKVVTLTDTGLKVVEMGIKRAENDALERAAIAISSYKDNVNANAFAAVVRSLKHKDI